MAKIPICFYELANEVRKNCNVTQFKRLSDGNFLYCEMLGVKIYSLLKQI